MNSVASYENLRSLNRCLNDRTSNEVVVVTGDCDHPHFHFLYPLSPEQLFKVYCKLLYGSPSVT